MLTSPTLGFASTYFATAALKIPALPYRAHGASITHLRRDAQNPRAREDSSGRSTMRTSQMFLIIIG